MVLSRTIGLKDLEESYNSLSLQDKKVWEDISLYISGKTLFY